MVPILPPKGSLESRVFGGEQGFGGFLRVEFQRHFNFTTRAAWRDVAANNPKDPQFSVAVGTLLPHKETKRIQGKTFINCFLTNDYLQLSVDAGTSFY